VPRADIDNIKALWSEGLRSFTAYKEKIEIFFK
jgi:hypothetical protein